MSGKFVRMWRPIEALTSEIKGFAVIILNRKIKNFHRLDLAWKSGVFKATADGGTNRLYDATLDAGKKPSEYVPDLISGDFDSIRKEVKEFYSDLGSKVVHTPNQDETDFSKCVNLVLEESKSLSRKVEYFLVFVDSSGRLDHIIQNTNEIIRRCQQGMEIYLVANNSITWCLSPGDHVIHIDEDTKRKWCAVIPAGNKPARVTTKGLKWDMTDAVLEFGGLISSSNAFTDVAGVEITTDSFLLFSIGLPENVN